jgi:hypothetical protein
VTSTADTTRHPDVSEISDLTEGLLPPARTAEVLRHLDECALCAEVLVSLDEMRGLLGTLAGAPRMPDDIANRIDAALAAETLPDVRNADDPADVSRETVPVLQPSELPATDRPAGRSGASTGPGRTRSGRRRRRHAVLGTAFGAAVIGAGVFLLQSASFPGNNDSSSTSADDASSSFAASGLEQRVHALLSGGSGSAEDTAPSLKKASPSLGDTSNAPDTAKVVYVPDCVRAGIGRDNALASQPGTYDGTKAYLVVLPHPSDPDLVQAYIVDATCVDAGTPARGQVLLTHSYARH